MTLRRRATVHIDSSLLGHRECRPT